MSVGRREGPHGPRYIMFGGMLQEGGPDGAGLPLGGPTSGGVATAKISTKKSDSTCRSSNIPFPRTFPALFSSPRRIKRRGGGRVLYLRKMIVANALSSS